MLVVIMYGKSLTNNRLRVLHPNINSALQDIAEMMDKIDGYRLCIPIEPQTGIVEYTVIDSQGIVPKEI